MGGDGHGEHVEGRGLMGQVDGANQVYPRRQTNQLMDVEDQPILELSRTAYPKPR